MQRLARICIPATVTVGVLSAVASVVLVMRGPAGWFDVVLAATAVIFLPTALVGAAVVRAGNRNATGWILLVAGGALPLSVLCQVVADAAFASGEKGVPGPEAFALVSGVAGVFGVPLVGTLGILLFPDGALPKRSRRLAWWCIGDLAALLLWALFSPTLLGTRAENVDSPIGVSFAGVLLVAILVIGPIAAFASRSLWRRAVATPGVDERQALQLAARVSFAIPAAYFVCLVVGFAGGDTTAVGLVENTAALAIGVASWIGIVRYGLFDLRAVLSRSIAYGVLAAVVVVVYATTSAALDEIVAGALPAVVAAALAAVAVLPLHERVQRSVNRHIFGLRNDPAAAFALLGARLDAAAAPEDVLPLAVATVADALRLRFVSIDVEGSELVRWGERVAGPCAVVQLPFAGRAIGRLVAQARDPREAFGREDRALLESLATQLGLAARAVALADAERASRSRLAIVREEERLRLRRDLHDGLGPTLAGLALGIDAARRSLPADAPATTGDLMAKLRGEAEGAVAEIRRIAYNLRPPILDDLGLCLALRDQAGRFARATVSAPLDLPELPSDVEVAAYRIATEAMTNAAKHAPQAAVDVRISVKGGDLELEISDTGAGLPDDVRLGVGILSMQERARELGGQITVTARQPHGTLVHASLPLLPVAL
jgi:signal transduction histidine kinase